MYDIHTFLVTIHVWWYGLDDPEDSSRKTRDNTGDDLFVYFCNAFSLKFFFLFLFNWNLRNVLTFCFLFFFF
jgi:hypothetical protein